MSSAPASGLPSGAKPSRYAALGDSFTIGTGSPVDRSFPHRLKDRWPGIDLLNLGVNGFTSRDLIERELPALKEFRPDFATVAVGANDIVRGVEADAYRKNLQAIFTTLAAQLPACRVLALPQPDWSRSPAARAFGSPQEIATKIRAFNQIMRDEAAAHGARYLDLAPLMQKQASERMLADDALHPSASAYDAWAEAIARELEREPLRASCDR